MRVPSGDHRGEMMGSLLLTIVCGSLPSASATRSW